MNINVCLLFGKIFVVNFDRGLTFTSKNIFLGIQKGLKSLKSICRPPVSLIDKRTLICDHIKNISSIAEPM